MFVPGQALQVDSGEQHGKRDVVLMQHSSSDSVKRHLNRKTTTRHGIFPEQRPFTTTATTNKAEHHNAGAETTSFSNEVVKQM